MTIAYVEAPNEVPLALDAPVLFLAGGISGCPDWQHDAVQLLESSGYPLTVLNPRRQVFPLDDPDAHAQQVAWEYRHLQLADHVLFWFGCTQVQPIALYELGMAAGTRGQAITVGCDPDYVRVRDVVEQLRWARPDVTMHHTLDATVRAAAADAGRPTSAPPAVIVTGAGLDDRGAYEVTVWVDRAPLPLRSVLPVGATVQTPHHGEVRILEPAKISSDRIVYLANPVWDVL